MTLRPSWTQLSGTTLIAMLVLLIGCTMDDDFENEATCEGEKCDLFGNRLEGANCSYDWQCKDDHGLTCSSSEVCVYSGLNCPEGLNLRSLWKTFASHDKYTIEGRTDEFVRNEEIQISDGPDGWLYTESYWYGTDSEGEKDFDDKLRNPEDESLVNEFGVHTSDSTLSMASYNLLQDVFAEHGQNCLDCAIEISVMDDFLNNSTDEELASRFELELSETIRIGKKIIADGDKPDATASDKDWAERYLTREYDLRCFTQRSLGIPWTFDD